MLRLEPGRCGASPDSDRRLTAARVSKPVAKGRRGKGVEDSVANNLLSQGWRCWGSGCDLCGGVGRGECTRGDEGRVGLLRASPEPWIKAIRRRMGKITTSRRLAG